MMPRTASTWSSTPVPPASMVKYCIAFLVVSVFPAPDSPLITRLWLRPSRTISRKALAATRKMCGCSWCMTSMAAPAEKAVGG